MQITPLSFELTINDGEEEVTGEIFIENRTAVDQTLTVSAIDVRSVGDDGQVAFVQSPVAGSSAPLSEFVRVSGGDPILKSGERRRVEVIVRNDQSLSPGGHYAAIVARFRDSDSERGQDTDIVPALSSLLLLRKIGGERYHISLNRTDQAQLGVQFSFPDTLTLTFTNDGNIHVTPRGIIETRDVFGRLVYRGIINDASRVVLPQTQRTMSVSLYRVAAPLPIMLYQTTIVGRSEPGDVPFRQEYSFVVLRPLFVLLTLLLVCIVYLRVRHGKRTTTK